MTKDSLRADLARVIFVEFAKDAHLRSLAAKDFIEGRAGSESLSHYLGRVLAESAVIYADEFLIAVQREDL
jgi:hypothetical protein